MTDRLQLLIDVRAAAASLSATARKSYQDSLTKALEAVYSQLSLAEAQTVHTDSRHDFFQIVSSSKVVRAILKKWDPRLDATSLSDSEARQRLIDLAASKITPHQPVKTKLVDFQNHSGGRKASEAYLGVTKTADLKAMLKSWDKHFTTTGLARPALLARLQALCSGESSPMPPPAQASKTKSKRATAPRS
ncbi:MAG TPA: hypothetical protein DCZ49_01850 [Hyphomonadaceae bacterium]|nr:hypothetical protein [Hyphomonadaceae bacterium]